MNKKMVFAALFCGFVLNNGYCFDEEHKITQEYLNRSFNEFIEIQDDTCTIHSIIRMNADNSECWDAFWDFGFKAGIMARKRIRGNLQDFGKEVLLSKIPSGKHKGKQVKDLLIKKKLNKKIFQTICDDSVKFWISDDYGITAINFELKNDKGGTIKVSTPICYYKTGFYARITFDRLKQQYFNDVDIEI